MKRKKRINKFLSFILSFILILPVFLILPANKVYAEEKMYSNVLDDLQKDSNFKVEEYPTIENDYSLKVVTIAESNDKELFVYVYQPFFNGSATSINISQNSSKNLNIKNYKLTLINSSETLFKYVVKDLKVSEEKTRYYTIISIFRDWNEDIDEENKTNENTIDEVVYRVGKEYQILTSNSKQVMNVVEIETIEITDKFVGIVRYNDGFSLVLFSSSISSFQSLKIEIIV